MSENKQDIRLGLLTETVTLALSEEDYVIEKVDFDDFKRAKVEFIVSQGVKAIIKGVSYNSGTQVKYDKSELKSSKTIFLHKASWNTSVDVQRFFGGSFELSLSISPTVKGSFSIVGSASVAIDHYPTLINYFGKSMKKAELEEAISADFKKHAKDDISALASKYLTTSSTEKDLKDSLILIENEFKQSSNKSNVSNMGIRVTKISLSVNTLPDTDEMINKIKDELTKKGLREINADETKRLAEEEDKKRQHELELERIKKTTITEKKEDIKKEINSVVVKDESKEKKEEKLHCVGCGKVVDDPTAKFCKHCGKEIVNNKPKKEKKYCTGCGKEVEDTSSKFCKHCGKEIK